jgi:hypothetical protein
MDSIRYNLSASTFAFLRGCIAMQAGHSGVHHQISTNGNSLRNLAKPPWHVFLFAIFPVLSLLANNTGQIDYSDSYRSFALNLGLSAILLLIAQGFLRNWEKAGALVTVLNILFFSYGHAYTYIEDAVIAGMLLGRHRVLAVLWLMLLVGSFIWIIRNRNLKSFTSGLNLVTLFLLVFPLYTVISFWFSNLSIHWTKLSENPSTTDLEASSDSPDVYFFILDQYARSDILADYFNYDNSAFLEGLEELGFYVASCGHSNYPYTTASLAATLNFNYVPELGQDFRPENPSYLPMQQAIKSSRVQAAFRQLGYQVIAFETGYGFTELESTDIFYELSSPKLNGFEALLLRSSALLLPADFGLLDRYILADDARKRERVLFVLDQLKEVPALPGKKFVFVHLVMPHPPFVFGPNGEEWIIPPYYENGEAGWKKEDFRRGYRNQAIYISTRILEVVDKIIADSPRPPLIMIQGDHGPTTIPREKRLSILSAYLFPGEKPDLYPTLTPVNNFRLVFNTYFNGSFPILPDQSFRVDINHPYVFRELKELPACPD